MKLVNVTDIAIKYDIARHTVWNMYRRDKNFPRPVQYVGKNKMPLFDEDEIDKYIKKKI